MKMRIEIIEKLSISGELNDFPKAVEYCEKYGFEIINFHEAEDFLVRNEKEFIMNAEKFYAELPKEMEDKNVYGESK